MRRPAALAVAGYALLALAWAMSNAPFGVPDEPSHYARAVGIAGGQLVGQRVTITPTSLPDAKARAWTQDETRAVSIPAGLSPVGFPCMAFNGAIPASCQLSVHPVDAPTTFDSTAGTFQPLPYLLPAAVVRLDSHPEGALRLARLAALVPCLLLIAAALLALGDGGELGLLGPLVALTPQVLFLVAGLTENGIEIASSFAWTAALLTLTRELGPGAGPGRVRARWALAGVAGLVLALSRSLGPGWIALDLGAVVLAFGWRPLLAAARQARTAATAAAAAVAVGIAGNRLWEAAHTSYPGIGLIPSHTALHQQLSEHAGLYSGAVAIFGWLDVAPPWPVIVLWGLLAIGLVAIAAGHAGRRPRWALVVVTVVVVLGVSWFSAVIFDASHFVIQGRDVLAVLIVPPLLAGELIDRRRAALAPALRRFLAPVTATLVALVQLGSFLVNSRRNAVGTAGSKLFFLHPAWSPPVGWWPWLALALLGAVALALAGIRARGGASLARSQPCAGAPG